MRSPSIKANPRRRTPAARTQEPRPLPVDPEAAIDTNQLGQLFDLAPITIQQQRARGEGPAFFRVGHSVRYRLGDVLAWRDARKVGGK